MVDLQTLADYGFQQAFKEASQMITFCAVGAHHQNEIIEQQIKELMLILRTLLLHAKRHWPDYITTMMWPFSLKEAACCLNQLSLQSDGQSCEATFFNVDKDLFNPTTYHVFGSPCFVLDSQLQSGIAGPPKWEPRSRLGIYVSHSLSHAESVALVLNPPTGHVSPQFYVVFDDLYSTVSYMEKSEVPPNWANLVENSREKVTEEDYNLTNCGCSQKRKLEMSQCKTQSTLLPQEEIASNLVPLVVLNCSLCQTQAL
jgi:hypothetical protein